MSLVRFRLWAFSLPKRKTSSYGRVAQLVEHLTFNQVVRGSNPRCLIQGNPEKLGFSYIMKDFEQNKKNAGKKRVHLGNCYREFSRQISDVLLRGKVVK